MAKKNAVADALHTYLTHEPDPHVKWPAVLIALEDAGYDLPKNYAAVAERGRKELVDAALKAAGQGDDGGE